jgi:hypothetical protein
MLPTRRLMIALLVGSGALLSVPTLRADPVPTDAELQRLIKDLDDEDFAKREAARRRLSEADPSIRPTLRKAHAETQDPEVKRRLELILKALDAKAGK